MELPRSEDAQSPLSDSSGLREPTGPTGPPAPPPFTIVSPRRVIVSPAIVALNVLVFAVMVVTGVSFLTPTSLELLRWGANHGPLVAEGEWWRLLTSAFVHVGILHIGFNMWVFRSLGPTAERLFGNAAFLLGYLASALGASLASILWNPAGISAGASGAIFGVAGMFLAFFLRHRQAMPRELFRSMMKSLITFVAINTMFGLIVPGIDNAAHLGGLFTGLLAGFVLERDVTVMPVLDRRRAVRGLLFIAALAAIALAIPARVAADPATASRSYLTRAQAAIERSDWSGVVRIADEWIALRPEDGMAWQVRGVGHIELGEHATARADFDRAIGLRDDLPYAYSSRAFLRLVDGDVEGALHDYDAVVRLEPDESWPVTARAHTRYDAKDWAGALRDFQTVIAMDSGHAGNDARLYAWVLRSRLTTRAAADGELREAVQRAIDGPWNPDARRIAAYLLGDLLEEGLKAESPRSALAMAHYFIGMRELFDGDRASAAKSFERCIETGVPFAYETMHAATELALLEK